MICEALHSELFSEIRVEFRVGMSFARVETRRDERHFFCYFCWLFFSYFPKLAKTKIAKKGNFRDFFANNLRIIRENHETSKNKYVQYSFFKSGLFINTQVIGL